MCGISGLITRKNLSDANTLLSRISASQFARGPDAHGLITKTVTCGTLALAHNRLKIIDLSDVANQPLWDLSQECCITFNGEIYNYIELKKELSLPFKSQSDTEVILNAYKTWGINCLKRFNGPFAFALYDTQQQSLYLCRDRFGKKPLFYCWYQGDFYFASSAKALAKELELKPNLAYVARGLYYWVYDDDSHITPYEGLMAIPPGHYLKVDLVSLQPQLIPYYGLAEAVDIKIAELRHYSYGDMMTELSTTLTSAVNIRLRSDVPLAISLSGGLDSTTIAAIATSIQAGLHSFTFGHPNELDTEAPLITEFIKKNNITPNYISPTSIEFGRAIHTTLQAQEAPFPSLSVVAQYLVYRDAKAKGIKVLLGGQGGDEILMGYRKYHVFYIKQLLQQKKHYQLIKALLGFHQILISEFNNLTHFWKHRHRYNKNKTQQSLLSLPVISMDLNTNPQDSADYARQLADVLQFSLPTLLRYEDRNSMGNSIESRLPFLDYRLVELGLALPTALKLNKGYGKWILRDLMKGLVPNQIRLARYKRGFDVMLPKYIHHGLGNSLRDSLNLHIEKLDAYLLYPQSIEHDFSNVQLISNPKRLAEALSLLWLVNPYGETQ